MHRVCITKRPVEIWQRLTDFWIKKNEILRLFKYVQLSESTVWCQKSRCDRNVALCILLNQRLFYPYRCKDMVPLFGWNPTELCSILTFDFIYQRHHHRLEPWNLYFLHPPYLQRSADAVVGESAPLYSCSDFVDGKTACICTPVLKKRVVYSQHTRAHGVKFQIVV